MGEWIESTVNAILGPDPGPISTEQMLARAFVVFIFVVAAIRVGDKRFMGRNTPLDLALAIMFGSIAARSINGRAPFFPTLITCCGLVALHFITSWLAFHSHWFGWLVKGSRVHLVSNGEILEKNMSRSQVTLHDLEESIRLKGNREDVSEIKDAYLERNGEISVVLKDADR